MMCFYRSQFCTLLVSVFGLLAANAHAQQIALIDSGVDPNAGYNLATGFNYFENSDDTSDISPREGEGHGTVSARVITESFAGEIVPYVVTDGVSSSPAATAARDSALLNALSRPGVRVVAITIGSPAINQVSAPLVNDLSNGNKVVVISASNGAGSQPNVLSTSSFNLAGVIIVGGTDTEGNLLPQSNRAGTTAAKFVGANGLPTADEPPGSGDSGASWAAARISGIAGAVLLQNPNLTATQVVEIILTSAQDRGAAGTDAEYGRGVILNAQQVLNNAIGEMQVPTAPETSGGGGGGSSSAAGLVLAGALAGGIYLLARPKTKLEKTLVLDSYGRAFHVDLNDQISVNDGMMHLSNFFLGLEQKAINQRFVIPDLNTQIAFSAAAEIDHRIDMVEYFAVPGDVVIENDAAQISFALTSQLNDKVEVAAGYRVSPSQTFGASTDIDSHELFGSSSFISGQSFSSVLSGFSEQAETASLSYAHGETGKFSSKLGFVSVNQSQEFGLNSFSSILEGKYQFNDKANVSMQFGQIEEKGSVLGGSSGGVFGVDTAVTYALNLAGHYKASERISLVANYGMGRTHVDSTEKSLLKDFSSLSSNWYSLGLIGNDIFRAKDQVGFALSQPLKIRSGSVNYSIPNGQDANYNIVFDTDRVDLSATQATERNLEAYYRTKLTDKLEFGGFVSYRKNPNHVSELGNDLLMMATLQFVQ